MKRGAVHTWLCVEPWAAPRCCRTRVWGPPAVRAPPAAPHRRTFGGAPPPNGVHNASCNYSMSAVSKIMLPSSNLVRCRRVVLYWMRCLWYAWHGRDRKTLVCHSLTYFRKDCTDERSFVPRSSGVALVTLAAEIRRQGHGRAAAVTSSVRAYTCVYMRNAWGLGADSQWKKGGGKGPLSRHATSAVVHGDVSASMEQRAKGDAQQHGGGVETSRRSRCS
eukprot:359469-Chlamydomonas_euryale.AAC.3